MENNMILFADTAEFNQFAPNVVKAMDFNKIKEHCVDANNKHILPFIDTTLFSSEDETIINYLKRIQANYATYEMLQIANMVLTKQGAMSVEGESLQPNFGEKQDSLAHYAETGDKYIDLLLTYLKQNEVETSKRFSSVFFSTLGEFETFRLIGSSYRTFFALMPFINAIEKLIVIPRLGDKLNEVLTLEIHNDLVFAIRGFIASKVMLKATSSLKLKYDNGITLTTFIPSLKSKFIAAERGKIEISLNEDIEMFGASMEQEINALFAVAKTEFVNSSENKGMFF